MKSPAGAAGPRGGRTGPSPRLGFPNEQEPLRLTARLVNELSNVPVPVMLMPDDFKAYSKIKVDNHLFNKENLPSRFKFKEYCPMVFRNLRERFCIDDQDYQNSLTRSAPLNSDSQGRFGNRFLCSYDHRFVIKTVSSEDIAEMHNILKKYHQVNELSNVPVPVMLMPDDFKAYSKIKVDNHLFNKENLPSRFKFKEYCPMVFRNLRERFCIDDQDYQNSLTRSAPLNSDSQGRFGNRFLCSYDHRFVIKTVSSEDIAEMHNILKKYHQFLGMYRLTVDGVETYMVVTRNVFSHRLTVHRKYDLKGSTVSREASDKEKAKELPTFKDNDFLNDGQKLQIGDDNKKYFLEKLKRDVEMDIPNNYRVTTGSRRGQGSEVRGQGRFGGSELGRLMVEVLYGDEPLKDYYTLMDIAYFYEWRRVSDRFI
ncbi:unnamed protein product [Menidia menidia]|uniref:1-phosphatidylinositol-5-phosphate 4-kinase n=1 Tax=Menidia menidia TaxID=238744 RepID=A0A8S4BCN3_9TELE|nr:unnamed protein product [Menidia menidia]